MRNDRFENFNRQRDIPQNYPVPANLGCGTLTGSGPQAGRAPARPRSAALRRIDLRPCAARRHRQPLKADARRRQGAGMFEVRIHGRGGQGVVTAAEMLSVAAFLEGKHAQAFPSFGSERTGARVVAFCRIATRKSGCGADPNPRRPDRQDPTSFMRSTHRGVEKRRLPDRQHGAGAVRHSSRRRCRPAAGRARGPCPRPSWRSNSSAAPRDTALLGAFAAEVGIVSLESLLEAIRRAFPGTVGKPMSRPPRRRTPWWPPGPRPENLKRRFVARCSSRSKAPRRWRARSRSAGRK